jgi:hypothetical protein
MELGSKDSWRQWYRLGDIPFPSEPGQGVGRGRDEAKYKYSAFLSSVKEGSESSMGDWEPMDSVGVFDSPWGVGTDQR